MPEILFIKTSSLGDVIHHLPAVSDARRQLPAARVSWVVEEAYAPLVALHPGIDRTIPVASRRWRRRLLQPETWREVRAFSRGLRATGYDIVIDTQGLIRSAVIARLARGQRHGYDRASIREPAASLFYDIRHRVDRTLHAIVRNRTLTARALDYVAEGPPDFGLAGLRAKPDGGRTAVLLHGTARPEKQWPVDRWRAIARALAGRGFDLVLPSGNAEELARSREIAVEAVGASMLHQQPLDAVARAIGGADIVIGVDTGLLHLAAALGVPLVAIFVGASDPRLTGPIGGGPIEVCGKGVPPTLAEVMEAAEKVVATGS
jgi:heptosyltransferase-1